MPYESVIAVSCRLLTKTVLKVSNFRHKYAQNINRVRLGILSLYAADSHL